MARSQTLAALLCATVLAAALSPAVGQAVTPILNAAAPQASTAVTPDTAASPDTAPAAAPATTTAASPAAGPAAASTTTTAASPAAAPASTTDIATTSTVGSGSAATPTVGTTPTSSAISGGEAPNNRTVGTQLVVPPGGCLIVSITSAMDQCLQDSSFTVNNQSIAIPADYRAAGIAGSNAFFNNSAYRANNPTCQAATPTVTQIYEKSGCILADAATATVGAAVATDIRNSFVCSSSGTDTTNYARAFGATAQEKKLCTTAVADAKKSIAAGDGSSASGDPCTAARATYIITNPCPQYNTTVNTTGKFFLAAFVSAPPPMELLNPAEAPGAAPDLAPATAPGFAPAPSNGSITASDLAPVTAPAPAPQSASRTAAFSAAAAVAAAIIAVFA